MHDRVMIVDDDAAILRTVKLLMADGGYDVRLAASGEQCLQMLREGFRGLVLMDIMMPGMDGWDTIDAIADQGLMDGNVICMLTALYDPGPKMQRLKKHVLDYIRKPFSREELLAAVEDSLLYV